MASKMLIDAAHPEETRVVVVDGSRVEEFDYETVTKAQISGNIYLARVTRVEPSLQAAFVEYGGGRHGFLAFSEIHPDYYQIPSADREALLAAEKAAEEEEDDEPPVRRKSAKAAEPAAETNDDRRGRSKRGRSREKGPHKQRLRTAAIDPEAPAPLVAAEADEFWLRPTVEAPDAAEDESGGSSDVLAEAVVAVEETVSEDAADPIEAREIEGDEVEIDAPDDDEDEDERRESDVEEVGASDAREEIKPRKIRLRDYKIQEVIKRRQILLVQVVKEERGTKGAALTTFLSLAGRYCVLMPNTPRGGGISRKITSAADRKRLKALASEFEVPYGMGLIVRTAGANRTKAEIKRDYEYLLRQWSAIRELTLRSIAPALIYEEGSLIKRAIRDLYNKDIDTILVEGEDAYREAKDYMKMLMPSHAKNVQPYRETTPLFIKHQIETQVSRMLEPRVQLKSGGYLIINVTEALVAVDVNSGKSTKEGSIEDTALKTNLEAAEEMARQMKLRDLAGLIVIDFIDMEEPRNNRAVEKRLKDKLKNDRARIQIGRISSFGLLEMSRQRLRPGLLEATTKPCPVCAGAGVVRSDESMSLAILRAIEEECVRGRSAAVRVAAPTSSANYILNFKRARIAEIEARYEIQVVIEGDPHLPSTEFKLERVRPVQRDVDAPRRAVQIDGGYRAATETVVEDAEVLEASAPEEKAASESQESESGGRRRRRRRDAEETPREAANDSDAEPQTESDEGESEGAVDVDAAGDGDGGEDANKKRRRGRRGGRRRRRRDAEDGADPMPVFDMGEDGYATDARSDQEVDQDIGEETGQETGQETGEDAGEGPGEAVEPARVEADAAAPASVADAIETPETETRAEDAGELDEEPGAVAQNAALEEEEAYDAHAHDEAEDPDLHEADLTDESDTDAAGSLEIATAARAAEQEPSGPPRTGWWALRRNG